MKVDEIAFEWRTYDEFGRSAFAFTDGSTMTLQMPWGEVVSVSLPLTGPITTALPRK